MPMVSDGERTLHIDGSVPIIGVDEEETMDDYDRRTIPHDPREVASDSRGWAAAAQLVPFVGLSFVGPLIIWLIKRDEDAYVEYHAREALNFQISLLIYLIVSAILIIILIGLVLLAVVAIYAFVVMIVAGVKAATGSLFRYPLSIRFIGEPS
jgi:uncharacterized Tic20 family protein